MKLLDPANEDAFTMRRTTRWLAIAALIILPLAAFRAALSGYFMLDDFGMLAIVRFLDGPLQPFVAEHIPGGLFYRPIGMLFWWLSERLFGSLPFWHYLCNLILHLAVAFSLGALVSALCRNRVIGIGVALVFAVHPIAIGTALWLSDRFDLLALLFGLQAARTGYAHSLDGRLRSLVYTLLLSAVALLSKEIALSVLAAISVIWIFANRADLSWRLTIRALISVSLLAAAYLVLRNAVISTAGTESLFALKPAVELLRDGVLSWLRGWIDYASYWPRLTSWRAILAVASASVLLALTLLAVRQPWTMRRWQIVLLGLAMWMTPALLQWPIVGLLDLRIGSDPRPIDLVVNSRYFYVALAGALIALAGFFSPLYTTQRSLVRRCISGSVIALVLVGLLASQHLARSYRNETLQQRTITEAAVAAIEQLELPSQGCQIYLLDTNNWMFAWISDEAIKAVTPDLARIAGCLIQTEHTPWYHLAVLDTVDLSALAPLTPVAGVERGNGELKIGSARILVLNLLPNAHADASPAARFLRFRDGQFVDVTQDVREGRRIVPFVCNRWASQCES